MNKNMLSIIIPSRDPRFLQKTIDDLITKAEGEIEIIVVFDGYWPEPMLIDDPKVRIIHHGTVHNSYGMRASINLGVKLSQGEYIMKIDEHCLVDQGYDEKLKADCEDDWIVIPRRYRLDAENWKVSDDPRLPVDYMYTEYPYLKPLDKTQGLHGSLWNRPERNDILIDDTPTSQGSCYFLKRSYWDKLLPNGMDDENYGYFTAEAQELTMPAWLSGGRVVVNKKTFYAHLHKGAKYGKGYGFSNVQYAKHAEQMEKGRLYCINYWLYTKDYQYDFKWFVNEKFPDMPRWPENWEEQIEIDKEKDYSTLKYKDDYWLRGLRGQN